MKVYNWIYTSLWESLNCKTVSLSEVHFRGFCQMSALQLFKDGDCGGFEKQFLRFLHKAFATKKNKNEKSLYRFSWYPLRHIFFKFLLEPKI